jgi:hypothetical protein
MTTIDFTRVLTARLAVLDRNVEKLNRRAAKKGVGSFGYTVVGTSTEKACDVDGRVLRDANGVALLVHYTHVVPTGEPLKLAGWTIVASLDHTTEAGVLVLVAPGQTVPVEYRTAEPICQHCSIRRQRNSTIVLRHEDGRFLQVGRNCLRDFLGIDPAAALASHALYGDLCRFLSDDEGFDRSEASYDVASFLSHVAYHIRTTGWISRSTARNSYDAIESTSSRAIYTLRLLPEHKGYIVPSEADAARAEAALEWARSLDISDESLSDYLHSVAVACASECLHPRTEGIVASIIPAYDRVLGQEVARRQTTDLKTTSRFIGTVGDRIEVDALILDRRSGEGNYGPWTLIRYVVDGSVLTWFASGEPAEALCAIGTTVRIKATVKDHKDRDGLQQTGVSRVAVAKAKAAKKAA